MNGVSQGEKEYNLSPSIGIPLWDGSSFTGKRLFVHSEQGFGDTLQFIRYLPMVKRLGGTVESLRLLGPSLGY